MRSLLILSLLLAVGCREEDPENDVDGDGFASYDDGGSDCDDADATINPDADEVCDGVDQDCDDDVDEEATDATTWYADGDQDGYGSAENSAESCSQPTGYIADATDCDDRDDDNNPGATEICDGEDNDCDDVADESGAENADLYYTDADGDGYGDPDAPITSCEEPTGAVVNDEDCDDTNAANSPDGTEVFDGVDNDCDDIVDQLDAGEAAYAKVLGESGSDELSNALAAGGDLDGDGVDDLIVGAWLESENGTSAGAAYVIDGWSTGTSSITDNSVKLTGEASKDYLGVDVAHVGDMDGDGFGDLLLGVRGEDTNGSDAGAAYLLLGPTTSLSVADRHASFYGEAENDFTGISVAGVGDVTGDGQVDLAIGSRKESTNADESGAVYIWAGPVAAGDYELADAHAVFYGENEGDNAGRYLGEAGDVDGDGINDLLIGASWLDDGGEDVGGAYIVHGPVSGLHVLDEADGIYTGVEAGDLAGFALDGIGDYDGDGKDDVLIGAPAANVGGTRSGAAYLVYGPASDVAALSDADAVLAGGGTDHEAGRSVAGRGDVNGDGFVDLLVGASSDPTYYAGGGGAYLVLGGGVLTGTYDLADANAIFNGEAEADAFGTSVAILGDQNGDGYDEIVVGASLEDSSADDAGALYVILGLEM